MSKPFSLTYRQKMIERMTGKDAISARQLSLETGIAQQNLSRWLQLAHNLPIMPPRKRSAKSWSIDEKVRILSEASRMSGKELGSFLEREGIPRAELEKWRLALEDQEQVSKATTLRIRKLERELARKEKALAEAAALLILKKKIDHLWEDEEDDTDGEKES